MNATAGSTRSYTLPPLSRLIPVIQKSSTAQKSITLDTAWANDLQAVATICHLLFFNGHLSLKNSNLVFTDLE